MWGIFRKMNASVLKWSTQNSLLALLGLIILSPAAAQSQETQANIEWSGGNAKTTQLEDSQMELQETFVFKNTGTEPVAIARVEVSCGCTAPSYTRDIIEAGGLGEITLKYETRTPGRGRELSVKIVFSTGAVAVVKWNIQNSPNPSTSPATSPKPPVSHPLVQWGSSDKDQVKIIKIKTDTSVKITKITGSDKVSATAGEINPETGEVSIEFKKLTDQPFWGAMMIEFDSVSSPPLRVNVRSLR